jgi:glycosyltransferase involved in cell wall biosynthesis
MHGGAVTLARKFLASAAEPDLLVTTDMLDLTTFLALTRHKTAHLPVAIYFHENQMCYPWSPKDRDAQRKRDHHYSFINYSSALAADLVLFNSQYHFDAFFDALPRFLKQFPDCNELQTVDAVRAKSRVLYLGMDLQKFDISEKYRYDKMCLDPVPLILWNHRWEYDKNPEEFFQALFVLNKQGIRFQVVILGENFRLYPPIFEKARKILKSRIVHYGYAEDVESYAKWLYRADILPVTSRQDFFGAAIVEALYCGCYPLLPKRLTYPELIPYAQYPDLFYTDFEDLVKKLARALREIDTIRQQHFRRWVEPYAWENMAPEYDQLFSALKWSAM